MRTRIFCSLAALLVAGTVAGCDQAQSPTKGDQVETSAPVTVDVSGLSPLDDASLAAVIRGATIRYAPSPDYFSDRYDCDGGWFSTGGTAPVEGEYIISHGQLCQGGSCARIYQVGEAYYRKFSPPESPDSLARRIDFVRRSSCAGTTLEEPVALTTVELRETLVGAVLRDGNLSYSFCANGSTQISGWRAARTGLYTIEENQLCLGNRCTRLYRRESTRRGYSYFIPRASEASLAPVSVQRPRGGIGC
jgi:hypothetical protein